MFADERCHTAYDWRRDCKVDLTHARLDRKAAGMQTSAGGRHRRANARNILSKRTYLQSEFRALHRIPCTLRSETAESLLSTSSVCGTATERLEHVQFRQRLYIMAFESIKTTCEQ